MDLDIEMFLLSGPEKQQNHGIASNHNGNKCSVSTLIRR